MQHEVWTPLLCWLLSLRFGWEFFFTALVCPSPYSPVPKLDVFAILWVGQKYFLVNETVPLLFLVSEDIGTSGNNYDRSVLQTVFHSAFPTLLSTCLHIPLSFFLSLPLSSFSLSEDGECWSVGVSSSFGLHLLRDVLYLVEKLFICTLQRQYRLIHFSEWGFRGERERKSCGKKHFWCFYVCLCAFILESHSI